MNCLLYIFLFVLALATAALAQDTHDKKDNATNEVCQLLGGKLHSVSVEECLAINMIHNDTYTRNGHAIVYKEYPPLETRTPLARVLLIGGIHGDEYASFSVTIKWMTILDKHHSGLFHWRIAPSINIDGLLKSPATRTNHQGVDLNRNMASHDWQQHAHSYWQQHTGSDPRKNPGSAPLSEIESQWLAAQIDEFNPDVVISLHAPYGLVDYDGPPSIKPPKQLGSIPYEDLPTFPGSLGRYAGEDLQIPILTIELKSSRRMPSNKEYRTIWVDLVRWLRLNIRSQ